MKSLLAVLAVAVTFAFGAAPALAMPAYDSGSDGVARAPAVGPPAVTEPSDEGVDAGALLALSAATLLVGGGIGFAAGRRPRRVAAA